MSYNTGYRVGNLIDQQRYAHQGYMPSMDIQAQGNNRMMPYGLDNYNPVPMGANGIAPSIDGAQPSIPQGGGGNMAGIAQMAGYLPGLVTDTMNAFSAPKYDTSITTGKWSGPNITHGLGDEIAKSRALKQSQEGMISKSVGTNTAKFAATGASIGSFFPGLGTAIGAGVGAITGALVGFFGGRRKKKKGNEQIASLDAGIQNKIEGFSNANIKARTENQQRRIALAQYNV
jgi:hypothetical protein